MGRRAFAGSVQANPSAPSGRVRSRMTSAWCHQSEMRRRRAVEDPAREARRAAELGPAGAEEAPAEQEAAAPSEVGGSQEPTVG
jgi:hypothetical protein